MTATKKVGKYKRDEYRLNCYAPGNGSLAFALISPDGQADGHYKITDEDIQNYIQNNEDGQRLTAEGWKVAIHNGYHCLIPPVKRTSPHHVEYNGSQYGYQIQSPAPGIGLAEMRKEEHIPDSFLHIAFVDSQGLPRFLVNWSIRDAIRFFLIYEKVLYKAS